MKTVAIVGAGVSGLAAAWVLREMAEEVVVLEKSRGVSGRAATRTRHGVRIDIGANYFKVEGAGVAELVGGVLSGDGLVDIGREVWTFDYAGVVRPGDAVQNREAKWVYAEGMSTLGKRLAEASGAEVRREVRVGAVVREGEDWAVEDEAGGLVGVFARVLLTPPAPQVCAILRAGRMDPGLKAGLVVALEKARYHRQFCFVFGLEERVERSGDYYGLVNTDGGNAVSWVSFEDDKAGRVAAGKSVVVVQMSPAWSLAHFEEEPGTLAPVVFGKMRELVGPGVGEEYAWWDVQRWRYAHPYAAADRAGLEAGKAQGLYFAGDALVGKGRVGLAMATGLEAGRAILESLRGEDGGGGAG